jgi:hypothetical protein
MSRLRTLTILCLACLGCLGLTACPKDEPNSMADPTPPKVGDGSNVVTIRTTVPYGKQVSCDKLLDAAKLSPALGETDPVTIVDLKQTDHEAAAVCSIRKGGKAPTAAEQAKKLEKNGLLLGVLPGDEICQLRAYCSFPYDVAAEKKRVEATGETCSEGDIGDLTCIKSIPVGPKDRTIVTVLDGDAKCRYTISPTTLVDAEPMKLCARTFVDQLNADVFKAAL